MTTGACGLVDRAIDSRSKGLGFDFHCWSCVEVLANFLFHADSTYPEVVPDRQELCLRGSSYLRTCTCMKCTLYSPREGSGEVIMIWISNLKLCNLPLPEPLKTNHLSQPVCVMNIDHQMAATSIS